MLSSHLSVFISVFLISSASWSFAADHRLETLDEPAPADLISSEIHSQLESNGSRIVRGTSRTVCEIWLCKMWPAKPAFQPTAEVLYPFQAGQLIGVLRFRRRGSDFRDQNISRGTYTLRYGQQPVDGNHEGTSPTRDFLLMVRAESDTSPKPMPAESLLEASALAAQSSHPAMMCLQQATDGDKPDMRHNEQHDWWIAHLVGKIQSGDKLTSQALDLVVVGHASE